MKSASPPQSLVTGRFGSAIWLNFILVSLIWGGTWLVIKTQLGVVPASWSVTWRFLVAAAVMFGLCLAKGKNLRLSPAQHGFAIIIGLLQFSLNFNLVYRAENTVTSGLVALSFALLLIPNALFAALFLGQRITRRFVVGSSIGVIGVALLFVRDLILPNAPIGAMLEGLGLAFTAILVVSVANVLQASAAGRAMPLQAGLAWSMLYGCILNAAIAFAIAGPPIFDMSLSYMAGLAYLGTVASAGAFSLYYALIRDIGPGRAAYTGVVVPLVALGLSTIFESYVWSPLVVFGAALAMAGLVIALSSR